jgi:hypothetical protein
MADLELASKIPKANPLHMLSNSSSTMLALPYHIISLNMIQNVKCHFWASHGSDYGSHNVHIGVDHLIKVF